MASVRSFHKYRGETSFTLRKLIEILKEQIPQVSPPQTKYKVTDIPTERTVRFYTASSLVDKPAGRDGANALYGYRQILQILAIKYLQSQYLPLVKIRSLVKNADNRELELLIPAIAPVTATHRGLAREDLRIAARSFLPKAGVIDPSPQPPQGASGETVGTETTPPDAWHRIEVGPGIELHVHAAALSAEVRERLRGALLRELGVLRGWFGEEKH
jgi:DNA-binding transcriptional MerR regulator